MDEPVFLARRATLDDLPVLRELWQQEQFDADALEKCITDFQVAYDAEGTIMAAIGMRREGEQGVVYSEAFKDFGHADRLRALIWERIKTIAKNYAMARLWMLDCVHFWKEFGFDEADEETLNDLPENFGDREGNWFTIMLRSDPFAKGDAMAKQQELMFREALRAETEKTMHQAKVVRVLALVLSILLFVIIVIGGIKLVQVQKQRGYGPGSYQR